MIGDRELVGGSFLMAEITAKKAPEREAEKPILHGGAVRAPKVLAGH